MPPEEIKQLGIIERYRQAHHAIARLIAQGWNNGQIRAHTGVTSHRIALLRADPTFQELIHIYEAKFTERVEQAVDAYTDLAMSNMIAAETLIADKLDEAIATGENLPTRELISIISDRADRFGYSKHTVHTVNHDFASRLDRAIARSGVKQIDAKAVEVKALPIKEEVPALTGGRDAEFESQRERQPIAQPETLQLRKVQGAVRPPASSRSGPSLSNVLQRRRLGSR